MSTILVVDDETGNVALVRRLMESLGHDVAAAVDGESGIEEARRMRPDLILLDVNMSGMNGFDVCRHLKSDANMRPIPIIMTIGLDADADRASGIDAGADAFLVKPFDLAELMSRVEALVRVKRQRDALEAVVEGESDARG